MDSGNQGLGFTWIQGINLLLGGSWVVIHGVISRVTVLITHIRGLITPLIATHEPPSTPISQGNRRLTFHITRK